MVDTCPAQVVDGHSDKNLVGDAEEEDRNGEAKATLWRVPLCLMKVTVRLRDATTRPEVRSQSGWTTSSKRSNQRTGR